MSSLGDEKMDVKKEPEVSAQSSEEPSISAKAEDLTTQALRFLSNASNETIGAIMVGLAGSTYLILGRLGLVIIGVVGGVVLHATWEQSGGQEHLKRESGLDVIRRVLDLKEKQPAVEEDDESRSLDLPSPSFDSFRPETAAALNELVDAVIKDYVEYWYSPILPKERAFPVDCRKTLTSFLYNVSTRLSRVRPADKFVEFLTNSTSIIVVFLNELSNAVNASPEIPSVEAVQYYLTSNPDSSLATILTKKQQKRKFHMVADDILDNFLDKSVLECSPAKTFLREILAGVILEMTLTSCSKPEWINGWIVYLLEDGEPEINHAIDMGMSARPADDLDGNVGNVGIAKPDRKDEHSHRKNMSRVVEEEALAEIQRLNQMIMEEDARRTDSSESLAPLETEPVRTITPDVFKRQSSYLGQAPLETAAPKTPKTPETPEFTASPKEVSRRSTFTNFDQILPAEPPTALSEASQTPQKPTEPLSIHNAKFTIMEDTKDNEKGRFRSKPTVDYWISVEPKSSQHPGWMINRRYADFEEVHEFLITQAKVLRITGFLEQHSIFPSWKTHNKASLRGELERYLNDTCWYKELAETERIKRFLARDQENIPIPKSSTSWQGGFENVGKGFLDAITAAPKGAAEGGKVVLGGVTGVFNNIGSLGQKIQPNGQLTNRRSTASLPHLERPNGLANGSGHTRASEDSLTPSPVIQNQPGRIAPMERRPSSNSTIEAEGESIRTGRNSISARSSVSGRGSASHSRDPSRAPSRTTPLSSPTRYDDEILLPPLPSDIPDDYEFSSSNSHYTDSTIHTIRTSTSTAPSVSSPPRVSTQTKRSISISRKSQRPRKEAAPLTTDETSVAIDLLFAVVNELYKLSSAWNIRRTLLNAAKTFLLKNGNQSLTSIQSLIQESVITANTSDAGIASHLRKLRQNSLPTEEELKAWPPELSAEEKAKLRDKARKLLLERGLPAALTGVMGQAATNEAMGRLFDCLQEEDVARGLIFGLLLQGVRAVTQ